MKKKFTVSVFAEKQADMLNRIGIVLNRRNLCIESITASESELRHVHRYTLVLFATEDQVRNVALQLEKITEVLKAFVHEDSDLVLQEIALYKMASGTMYTLDVENIVRESNARILAVTAEYIVIEKTGHKKEIQSLFDRLENYGILEFACSGSVAVTRPMKQLSAYLKEFC
jgi:acetolactate synthase-1/3 small subunit